MFNNQRAARDERAQPSAGTARGGRGLFSVIGPDMVVTGNVAATADLHVEGRIDGDVQCAALVQGEASVIRGSVVAESARIAGTIEGSIRVRQLTVEQSARITGDVDYESLGVETGARIDGRLKQGAAGEPGGTAALRAVGGTDLPGSGGQAA